MTFTEFVNILKPIIGGSDNTIVFTKTLFEVIIEEDKISILEEISRDSYKAYFNGNTKITKLAQKLKPYIDVEGFVSYVEEFNEATQQELVDAFSPYIENLTPFNVADKIAYFLNDIILEAAKEKRKSTPKSAKNTDSYNPKEPLEAEVMDDETSSSAASNNNTTYIDKQINIFNNDVNNFDIKGSTVTFNL